MQIVVPDEFKELYAPTYTPKVRKIPDPVLRQKAAEVLKINRRIGLLVDEMLRQMKEANGIGLAAPQLGVLDRVIVIAPQGMRPTALINPVIVQSDGSNIGQEGCLSIPGLYGDVERYSSVIVEAFDRKGRAYTFELEGLPARVVQHEIDHLDGVLFIDKVDVATLHWEMPGAVAAE